ncbi:hypothetical protein GCM10023192_88480 [Amycolatopsis samaneae]
MLRVASYNLLEFGMYVERAGEKVRYDRVAEVIRNVDADVWAVQELADEDALRRLANTTGLRCDVPDSDGAMGEVACDPGRNGFGVGLLWKPGIEPLPGTLRRYTFDVYFHGLVKVELDVGGIRLQAASAHLTPFGSPQIVTEARRVVSNLTRPDGCPPGFVGSDSNSITGDRIRRQDGRWDWHAADPYAGQDWYDALVWQCTWRYDPRTGRRIHRADRAAGDVLRAGGLHDTGAVLDVPFAATVGYWPTGDPYGPRDIDHIRVTTALTPAIRSSRVYRCELALTASDHLPKVAEIDLAALAERPTLPQAA